MRDKKWQTAMDEEIKAMYRNNIWELTKLLEGSQPIDVKWVFKKEMNAQGKIERYKARIVVRRSVCSHCKNGDNLIAHFPSSSIQMDVKSVFLNVVLEKEVYLEQPPGYMKI